MNCFEVVKLGLQPSIERNQIQKLLGTDHTRRHQSISFTTATPPSSKAKSGVLSTGCSPTNWVCGFLNPQKNTWIFRIFEILKFLNFFGFLKFFKFLRIFFLILHFFRILFGFFGIFRILIFSDF